jgi:hypothetical protein|tara:strand:+ start:49 stop:513 length:465 start_codon:yes stop_codon:yes gene_type:complete
MKIINYNDIKTPTTVEEFRENLKKYYCCIGSSFDKRNELFTGDTIGANIDDINSFSDLYSRGITRLVPYVDFDVVTITPDEMCSSMGSRNFECVLQDKSRFKIHKIKNQKQHNSFMSSDKPKWVGLDNQIYREFFIKTLGKFSGYTVVKELEVA